MIQTHTIMSAYTSIKIVYQKRYHFQRVRLVVEVSFHLVTRKERMWILNTNSNRECLVPLLIALACHAWPVISLCFFTLKLAFMFGRPII